MKYIDFSYWAVIVFLAGSVIKYVFTDIMAHVQRRLENSKSNEAGYNEAVSIHSSIGKLISFEKYMRSSTYSKACFKFGQLCREFSRFLFLGAVIFCVYPLAMTYAMKNGVFSNYPVLTIATVCVVIGIIETVINVPFDLYDTFVIESRFGFNTQTLRGWIDDFVKGVSINALYKAGIIVIAYIGIFLFTEYIYKDISSPVFIIFAVACGVAFSLFWESISIDFIEPLFNKFTPMENNDLKKKIISLISDAGYSVSDIFIMDAGKRSKHSNAYFSGWGSKKRIVLYDTLLENHSDDEILAILGHEAGHLVHGDIMKWRIESAIYSAAIIYISVKLATNVGFYHAFGFDFVAAENIRSWYLIGFSLASLVIESITWLLTPVWNIISRHDEYAADSWSVQHVSKDAMASALIGLYAENLDMLHDHPAYEFWYYGHPGVKNRINAIMKGE